MDISETVHPNDRLRQERIGHNWRQQDLADQLGTTALTVGRWERGSQHPSAYFRVKLCALFGKRAEELGLVPESAQPACVAEGVISGEQRVTSSPEEASLWNVPFPRNLFFTGRASLLEHLQTVLTHESTIAALTQSYALHGLGGIGKTQLAIEYAYQHRSDYNAVLWVEAETQTTLVSSFMALAVLLTLPEKMEGDQTKIVAAILRWLNEHKGWLLIFDNVEDLSLLKPFLPASDQGALLLTTRLQSLGTLAQRVELPPMTMQEGCDFLLARTNRLLPSKGDASIDPQELAVAQQIVSEMGGLPLALEQAGAYIDATRCDISDYMHLFRTAQHRLLGDHELSSNHPLSVSRTFTLVFEKVEQRNPLAAELLTICAFLAPDAIPEMFFLEGASLLGSTFEARTADPLAFSEAIKVLLSYSLIQRHTTTHTITVHRLVQVVLKGTLPEALQRTWVRRVLRALSQLFPAEKTQTDYWQTCEWLLPHARLCTTLNNQWREDILAEGIILMVHIAVYLSHRAWYTAHDHFGGLGVVRK
jgi:transcriptional regulator with XRE-family HTH domain